MKYYAAWSEQSTPTVDTESSKGQELDLESFFFLLFSTTYFTWLREQQKYVAHGNESATILSGKVSQPTHYAHKKNWPTSVLDFNSILPELEEQQKATIQSGSEFEKTLMKEAIVLICDSTGRMEILG